jgi:hypothetical protein
MNAYKESYLNNAADTFGSMMNYAVNDCGLDGDAFLHMFVTSGLAEQFGRKPGYRCAPFKCMNNEKKT